ncbi:MAG: hypothetical protein ACOYJF_11255 [Prevotella sp.]|jgi:hypothetical protein
MASGEVDIRNPFVSIYKALSLKDQRKALRGAMRREANRLKKQAAENMATSGLGSGTNQKLSKGIRTRVYPSRYGAGFMLSVKPRRKKGFHKNRQGLEKPVLMWAEEGTNPRKTKGSFFSRKGKGHVTGRMRRYGFLRKTEQQAGQTVEQNLFRDFQDNLNKAARKQGLL